jgi:hypothetical protein
MVMSKTLPRPDAPRQQQLRAALLQIPQSLT